MKKIQIT